MSVTASRPATPAVAVPAPQAAPTPPDRESSSPPVARPFAELLRQNRGAERAPVEPPRPARTDDAAEPQMNATEVAADLPATNDLSTRSDAGRARARGAASARAGARTTSPTERAERDGVAPHERSDDDGMARDGTSAANAAGVARPEAQRLVDAEPRMHAGAEARRLGEASEQRRAGATTDTAGAFEADGGGVRQRLETDSTPPAGAGRSASRGRDGAAPASAATFAQALAEAKTQDRPASAAGGERPLLPTFDHAVAAQEPLAQAGAASDASALTTTLPTPIDSPEFASALGVQVSVFVREGVQHAELHLNPAETGPVSIAITLEGTQARVEFGADLAATRQAIENGLPALASALRDAGFTLAGGGVAQHSRSGAGQGGDDPAGRGDPRRARAAGSDATVVAAAQRASRRIAAGGVDLYA